MKLIQKKAIVNFSIFLIGGHGEKCRKTCCGQFPLHGVETSNDYRIAYKITFEPHGCAAYFTQDIKVRTHRSVYKEWNMPQFDNPSGMWPNFEHSYKNIENLKLYTVKMAYSLQ